MLPSPSSSPQRPALETCTNLVRTPITHRSLRLEKLLPTPPEETSHKRKARATIQYANHPAGSRLNPSLHSEYESESDDDMLDLLVSRSRARQRTAFCAHMNSFMRPTPTFRCPLVSTLPILQSFVSSNKSDVFKCQSVGADTYLTPPYACSYTHGSKLGGTPLLAVATEQGSVHILNTSRRKDWDTEPTRVTLQPHNNGVFDVKWNGADTHIVTCSGDQSARITCVERGAITHVLRGHSSTVKCAAWDPAHPELLTTGGRDGAIFLWDLRVGVQAGSSHISAHSPVSTIANAHEDTKSKPGPRRKKNIPLPRTVTGVLYPDSEPYGIVSSDSFDGILRYWDLRTPKTTKKPKPHSPACVYSSPIDPTVLHGSRRPRGIISLISGSGPTAGVLFGLGADSRVHTYTLPTLAAQSTGYVHKNMQTNSFYVGLALSPCGRWLASGGTGTKGSNFLFDVSSASRGLLGQGLQGVELGGQKGEVGAVDWAQDMLATCADDGTVRVWRPDIDVYRSCQRSPEEAKWDWSWST